MFRLIFSRQSTIYNDLFNRFQWELFLSVTLVDLKKFSLKIGVDEESEYEINDRLASIQSSWWLNEKKWFIEYISQEKSFITIPDFCPKMFDNTRMKPFDIQLDPLIFYSCIKELKIHLDQLSHPDQLFTSSSIEGPRFCNVKRISLNGNLKRNILYQIRDNINTSIIEHVQFFSTTDDIQEFLPFLIEMTNLSSLDIQSPNILRLFDSILSPLCSIRRLKLCGYPKTRTKSVLRYACRLFPDITSLTIEYHSRRILRYLLNKFVYLEEIHFHLNDNDHVPNHSWINRNTRLNNHSFISQIFSIKSKGRIFIIWLNQEKNIEQSDSDKCRIQ